MTEADDGLEAAIKESAYWRILYTSPWREFFIGRVGRYIGLQNVMAKPISIGECLERTVSFQDPSWKEKVEIGYKSNRKRMLMAGVLQGALFSMVIVSAFYLLKSPRQTALAILFIIYATLMTMLLQFGLRRRANENLATALLELLFFIELNPVQWKWPYNQRRASSRIERCARLFEQVPGPYGGLKVRSASSTISHRALGIAEHFRQHATWVAFPDAETREKLMSEVRMHFMYVADNNWYMLPATDLQVNLKTNRIERLVLSALVVVLFGGLLTLAVFQGKLGLSGTLASSVLAIIIVLLLARLGLSISALQQAADAAKASGMSGGKAEN